EQFGAPYELPNLSSWSETCASYGNAVWNHRMFLLHKDGAYIDVMERVLYNGFADGVSLKGDRFFYQNPLKSFGDYDRFEWINTPCCPPNVVRLTASIGSYIYAESADSIYVNLFIGSKAKVNVGKGNTVELAQQTRYPWTVQCESWWGRSMNRISRFAFASQAGRGIRSCQATCIAIPTAATPRQSFP